MKAFLRSLMTVGLLALSAVGCAQAQTPVTGTVYFANRYEPVVQPATSATVYVNLARTAGTDGAVSTWYNTGNSCAAAGVDYIPQSGWVNWAAGDSAPKPITITLTGKKVTKLCDFGVGLWVVKGGVKFGNYQVVNIRITPATTTPPPPPPPPPAVGTLGLASTATTVAQNLGSVSINVNRTAGSSGVVTVQYTTVNGTAVAGTDYTAAVGTLSWADADTATKSFSVPLSIVAFNGSKTFSVTLSSVTGGAALGTASEVVTITGSGTVTPPPPPPPPLTNMSIRTSGGHFIDSNGNIVQLRGVNISGLETVAAQGWNPANPWGAPAPSWTVMRNSWGANAVRLPLNEASWLGYSCAKNPSTPTVLSNPDPGANYKATVLKSVTDAQAAGLYVIFDLHWSAPNINGVPICPLTQNAMAAADHAVDFWTSVANAYKDNTGVIFELFNEPFINEWATGAGPAGPKLLNGAVASNFMPGGMASMALTWNTAGFQQMLDAVRATGATNVVLIGSDSCTQHIVDFLAYKPVDPLNQIGAAWHPYPIYYGAVPQVRCVGLPNCSPSAMAAAKAVVAAGYPVAITEYGDNVLATSGVNSPWSQILLPWADDAGISYLGWTWNVWQDPAFVLIRDAAGTPTYGYGEYVKQHMVCVAAGNTACQ